MTYQRDIVSAMDEVKCPHCKASTGVTTLYSIARIDENGIIFKDSKNEYDKILLTSKHDQSCCESHYLDFSYLENNDFSNLLFDLNSKSLIEKVPGYGIRLVPTNGHPISIPGYADNNGYYTDDLTIVIKPLYRKVFLRKEDITSCQKGVYICSDNERIFASIRDSNVAELICLLEDDNDVNYQDDTGNTFLMFAAWLGEKGCIEVLLNAGANRDLKNEDGHSAQYFAELADHPDCVELLKR